MKKTGVLLAVAGVYALVGGQAQAQIMEMNGTWALNKDLSFPKAQCEYLHYTVTADEEHYIVDEISNDGKKFNTEYRAKFDGKEHPNKNLVTGEVNYVKVQKVLDRVEQVTNIRHDKSADGKEVSVIRGYYIRLLSLDGKQISSVLTSVRPDGSLQVTGVRVFDKVEGKKPKC